ncbi:hypothetical protein E3U55_16935 [Filobacillus milosensis]|uniref:Uncharacterized protein n=1 Tax=Filobacillus milosensis TaxID=94137 RepID=A0A4Y8ICZ8_9BACI|nr:hypothetical protein [Filobacillus milosensis]TFB12916.1 hypothetical protein E3U55_16935 [Filobacillus milosensis]
MKFEYKLSGLGWADGLIEANSQTYNFNISYLSDGLGDFLTALMELNQYCVPEDEVKVQTSCTWHAEPSGTELILKLSDKMLNIKMISYDDIDLKLSKQIEIDTSVSYYEFLFIVIERLDFLLKKHGLIGYRDTWYEHDFPISSYLKLKQYLISKSSFHTETFVELGYEMEKSDINEEMKLLMKYL